MIQEEVQGTQHELQAPSLSLLPLKNVVILPKSIIPVIVGRKSSIQAVEFALKHNKSIFITAQKEESVENPVESDLFAIGTRSAILQVMRMPNGALKILAEGICRARMTQMKEEPEGFFRATYEDFPTTSVHDATELAAEWRHLKTLYHRYAQLNDKVTAEITNNIKTIDDMDCIADTIAINVNLSLSERQEVLEIIDVGERIVRICQFLKKEIEILETEQRIRGRIQSQVDKNQREYYLTEQIKAIQKELGREDQLSEIEALRAKVKALKLGPDAAEKVEKELKRLEQMPPLSSEAVVSRHYVDWITALPWHKKSRDTISLTQAEKMLNKNHAALKKVKERIIEFIAAKKFSSSIERSPIICLSGPPGVGKTSLAESIAKSLNREFARISLGGIKDEAEIRGHRRTYIGALPGKIIQAMRKAKTVNPVILLDEIDKLSSDIHGDPASALLEVLDPEQNKKFIDNFMDVEYDLSRVMFIATANHIDNIPYALFDRMEIIGLSGYTTPEKMHIARKFLIPKNLKEHSLDQKFFKIAEERIEFIVTNYTREAGVRQLERLVAKLMRKVIQLLLKNKTLKNVSITEARVREWLGHPKFRPTSLTDRKNTIGLVTGLAWTEVGGDVMEIETSIIAGKGTIQLTGQLGEVMQESVHAALSYLRMKASDLGIVPSFSSSKDIHIHIPEGSTPKEGPSAGIGLCLAVLSALTKNPVKPGVAMTGEITLQGRVLAIGGLREKLLAAKQRNMRLVIVPKENAEDLDEVLHDLDLGDMEVKTVSEMDEVLKLALSKNPIKKKTRHMKRVVRRTK